MNLKNNTSKIYVVDYPTEKLKSMGYQLTLETSENNPKLIMYLDHTEAEGKNILIVRLELVDKNKKGLIHIWVRDPLGYLNSEHKRLFWPEF